MYSVFTKLQTVPSALSAVLSTRVCFSSSASVGTTSIGRHENEENLKSFLDQFRSYERSGVPRNAAVAGSTAMDLTRMLDLLRHLGSPQKDIQNVVHVVGTKGKGSTARMLASMLDVCEQCVGLYTSPHVVDIRERISIGDSLISATAIGALIASWKWAVWEAHLACGEKLTAFEILTGLAIRHFADQEVKWIVMEAGIGGVTDATNVFNARQVKAVVVTAIEEDHVEALGGSLQSIVKAKAGIVKPGCDVVVAPQPLHGVTGSLVTALQEQKAATVVDATAFMPVMQRLRWTGHNAAQLVKLPSCGATVACALAGSHQAGNIAAATATVDLLIRNGALHASLGDACTGLQAARLPGRFEVHKRSLGGHQVWHVYDCAHTRLSAEALAASLTSLFGSGHPIALVIGMAVDKDVKAFARGLQELQSQLIICVEVAIAEHQERTMSSQIVREACMAAWGRRQDSSGASQPQILDVKCMAGAEARLRSWLSEASCKAMRDPVVCFTGSNYAVSAALDHFKVPPSSP